MLSTLHFKTFTTEKNIFIINMKCLFIPVHRNESINQQFLHERKVCGIDFFQESVYRLSIGMTALAKPEVEKQQVVSAHQC